MPPPGTEVQVGFAQVADLLQACPAQPDAWLGEHELARLSSLSGARRRAQYLAGRWLGWARGEASVIGWLLQTKALIMIIFANILLDKQIITSETFTALLLMAVVSTMLTVPLVAPKLARIKELILRSA